jgi:hypothetical protein
MKKIFLVAFMMVAAPTSHAQAPPPMIDAAGDLTVMILWASGVQVYDCRPSASGALAWSFRAPRAELYLGSVRVGKHDAGPSWEHDDGSKVTGKVAGRMEASFAGAIPHLRLEATQAGGTGAFAAVSAIKRINTRGGALSGVCPAAGDVREVPYTADYVMIKTGG